MTMLYSSDGFDYDYYDLDPKTGMFVCKDCRSCDPDDDIYLDLELEYYDFCDNFGSIFESAPGFVCVGEVRLWDGTYGGGKVFTDIQDGEDFLRRFTEGYRGSQYEIRVDDENGKLYVKTIDHDGGMRMYVRELTERGLRYYEDHEYDMDERELHRKLMETRGFSKDVFAANRVWGTPLDSKNRKKVGFLKSFGKKREKKKYEYHGVLSGSPFGPAGKPGDGTVDASNVYQWAVRNMAPEEIDHEHGDLYLKVTPVSRKMVETQWKYGLKPKTFVNQIDGQLWFDFAFCAMNKGLEEYRNRFDSRGSRR